MLFQFFRRRPDPLPGPPGQCMFTAERGSGIVVMTARNDRGALVYRREFTTEQIGKLVDSIAWAGTVADDYRPTILTMQSEKPALRIHDAIGATRPR